MSSGVETPTALVATAECSVPNLLSFAIMGSLAVMQNLRKKILRFLYVFSLFNDEREEVGYRAQLTAHNPINRVKPARGRRATWDDRSRQTGNTQ